MKSFDNAVGVLQGHFVSKEEEYQRCCHIGIVNRDSQKMLQRMREFAERLLYLEFCKQVDDIIEVGLRRYRDNNGRDRDITKVKMKMRHAVRDDLLRYLQSNIKEEAGRKSG